MDVVDASKGTYIASDIIVHTSHDTIDEDVYKAIQSIKMSQTNAVLPLLPDRPTEGIIHKPLAEYTEKVAVYEKVVFSFQTTHVSGVGRISDKYGKEVISFIIPKRLSSASVTNIESTIFQFVWDGKDKNHKIVVPGCFSLTIHKDSINGVETTGSTHFISVH